MVSRRYLGTLVMSSHTSVRWLFDCAAWQVSAQDWFKCLKSIQPEERERIGKFVFQNDAMASMVGRLLMRKLLVEYGTVPWRQLRILRSEKGKPYVQNMDHIVFNVSHHGRMVALAAEIFQQGDQGLFKTTESAITTPSNTGSTPSDKRSSATPPDSPKLQLGVDICDHNLPRNTKIPEFFRLMRRNFHAQEWDYILSPTLEHTQLNRFYRMWSLKESYVKATGTGISVPLDEMCFHVMSEPGAERCVYDTRVSVQGRMQEQWLFEETRLREKYCVAVALHGAAMPETCDYCVDKSYESVNIEQVKCLMEDVECQDEEEIFHEAQDFVKKQLRSWDS